MKISQAIEKTVEIRQISISKEGLPFFDLMMDVYVDNGHGDKPPRVSSTYVVFYATDENTRNAFVSVLNEGNIEHVKKFLKSNTQNLYPLSEAKDKFGEMTDKACHAFANLHSSEKLKETLSNAYYGCAHLVEDKKLLVFWQSDKEICDLFFSDTNTMTHKNLNTPKNYITVQNGLKEAYDAGKIKPEAVIEGGAFEKILNNLCNTNLTFLTDRQKEIFMLIDDFKKSLGFLFSTEIKSYNDEVHLFLKQTDNVINITLPKTSMDNIQAQRENTNNFLFNADLPELFTFLAENLIENNVNNFLKKKGLIK